MVYGRIKEEPYSPFMYEEEVPSWEFFHKDKPIPLLGKLYNRGTVEELGEIVKLPDLYLARKQINLAGHEDAWASVEYTARDVANGNNKYQSYDGNPLEYHVINEREMMWLQDTEIDVVLTQKHLAEQSLEKWDD